MLCGALDDFLSANDLHSFHGQVPFVQFVWQAVLKPPALTLPSCADMENSALLISNTEMMLGDDDDSNGICDGDEGDGDNDDNDSDETDELKNETKRAEIGPHASNGAHKARSCADT